MTDLRHEMEFALKSGVVPVLRSHGFKGSFPHFYRENLGHIDLLTFQFSFSGGSFLVEISYVTPSRNNIPTSLRAYPVAKLRVGHTGNRLRLYVGDNRNDHWFTYGPPGILPAALSPSDISKQVALLVVAQAEPWWESHRGSS